MTDLRQRNFHLRKQNFNKMSSLLAHFLERLLVSLAVPQPTDLCTNGADALPDGDADQHSAANQGKALLLFLHGSLETSDLLQTLCSTTKRATYLQCIQEERSLLSACEHDRTLGVCLELQNKIKTSRLWSVILNVKRTVRKEGQQTPIRVGQIRFLKIFCSVQWSKYNTKHPDNIQPSSTEVMAKLPFTSARPESLPQQFNTSSLCVMPVN